MDSPPPASGSNQRKKIRIWLIIAAACLMVGIVAINSSKEPVSEPNFVWLDQAQFARQMRPGRLKRLYYQLVYMTAPVWQRFRRPKTNIQITSKILAVHGVTAGDFGIGTAIATNESRTQAWILSPAELDELRQRLEASDGLDLINAPRITVADGMPASISVGTVTPIAVGNPNPVTFVGITVDVNPKILSHRVALALSTVCSEPVESSATSPIRTNLSAACRLIMSNAGGVLITGPPPKEINGTNYWIILSPTAIDGFGKPIKL